MQLLAVGTAKADKKEKKEKKDKKQKPEAEKEPQMPHPDEVATVQATPSPPVGGEVAEAVEV